MSRGFRKFYKSEADFSNMIPSNVELTLGHSMGYRGTYLTPKETEILQDYEKVIDRITIDEKHRLEKRNKELEAKQSDYFAEIGELREEFDEMKRLFVHLSKGTQKQLIDEFNEKVGDKADIEWSCDD